MSQRPLRILLTDPHSDGGGQVRYLQSLAGELVRLGHEVTIGCRPGSVLVSVAKETGARVIDEFYFARGLRPAKWAHDIRLMRSWLRQHRPDIVHVSGSQDHWVSALARLGALASIPLVRTRHNTYRVKRGLANRLLNRRWTTWQIAVCEMVRRDLAGHPAFNPARLQSIHNGVNTETYRGDAAERARARAAFGYGGDDLVFGIAARLVAAKGHTYLFQAAARARADLPAMKILVLGQGALEPALRAEARALGIEDIVQFAGFRDDMPRSVQAFDIGVLPSIDCDTSSFSLKEQMAAGIPVVASDYGGLPEIVSDGVEGIVVANGAVAPLADALRLLAGDPALRDAMGTRGRARVEREFSLESFAARTVDVYRMALAATGKDTMDRAHEDTTP